MKSSNYYLKALSTAFTNRFNNETESAKTEELIAILHHINEALRLNNKHHARLFRHHCGCLLALCVYHLESEVYEALFQALN